MGPKRQPSLKLGCLCGAKGHSPVRRDCLEHSICVATDFEMPEAVVLDHVADTHLHHLAQSRACEHHKIDEHRVVIRGDFIGDDGLRTL